MAKVYDTATDLIAFARLQSQNTTSGSSYLGSDGLLKFAAEDEPRIEYGSDGSLKGLLIEEQRTNLVTYSEDFSEWLTTGSASLGTIVTAPTGDEAAVTLDLLNVSSALYETATVAANVPHTFSVWLKGDVAGTIRLARSNSGSDGDNVPVSTEWTRQTVTITPTTTSDGPQIRRDSAGQLDKVYIYGAQLEQGSFPTSYIPTSGSQQTRSADVASIPVSAFGYNQDAGTVVVEAQVADTSVSNAGDLRIKTTTGFIFTDAGSRVGGFPAGSYTVYSPTTSILMRVDTVLSDGQPYKAAYSIAESNSALSVNGSSVVIDQTTTIAGKTASLFELGKGSSFLNGHIKSLKYYPRRLTNTQLQELTS